MIYDYLDDPADYSPALIIGGPRDGEVIDWPYQTLVMPVLQPRVEPTFLRPDILAPLEIETLTYRRVKIGVGDYFPRPVALFVPADWPNYDLHNRVVVHLIRKAFTGAKGIRRPGS